MKEVNLDNAVKEAAEKFEYDEELVGILQRVVPTMADGKENEERAQLADTLLRTKIFVIDHRATEEDYNRCKDEIIGDLNLHMEFVEQDLGEYGKNTAPAAYVSEPIFNENMDIVDRKSFLYVSRMEGSKELAEKYGTTIDLSHFIHELGHAWASEKDEFMQDEMGNITTNIGTYKIQSMVDRENHKVIDNNYTGLLLEDALNTIQEEEVLCKVLGIESVSELTSKGYTKSAYQGSIATMMKDYIEKFGIEGFDRYRFRKDKTGIEDFEKAIETTEAWERMQDSSFNDEKRKEFGKVDGLSISEHSKEKLKTFFEKYDDVYFPDNSKFTPVEKLENVFTQLFNFGTVKYSFDLSNPESKEAYQEMMLSMLREGYVMRNQAPELKKEKEEIKQNEQATSFKEQLKVNVNEVPVQTSEQVENSEEERAIDKQER